MKLQWYWRNKSLIIDYILVKNVHNKQNCHFVISVWNVSNKLKICQDMYIPKIPEDIDIEIKENKRTKSPLINASHMHSIYWKPNHYVYWNDRKANDEQQKKVYRNKRDIIFFKSIRVYLCLFHYSNFSFDNSSFRAWFLSILFAFLLLLFESYAFDLNSISAISFFSRCFFVCASRNFIRHAIRLLL